MFLSTCFPNIFDRSQLATVILAAREDVYGVCVGGILGHALCTGLAVIGGRIIATRISVKTVTLVIKHSGRKLKWCMTFVLIVMTSKHFWLPPVYTVIFRLDPKDLQMLLIFDNLPWSTLKTNSNILAITFDACVQFNGMVSSGQD